jgi:hypothetical protein
MSCEPELEPNVDFGTFVLSPKNSTSCFLRFDAPGAPRRLALRVRGRERRKLDGLWIDQVRVDGRDQLIQPIPFATFMERGFAGIRLPDVSAHVEFVLRNETAGRVTCLLLGELSSLAPPASEKP